MIRQEAADGGETPHQVLRTGEQIAQDVGRMGRELRVLTGDRVPIFIALLKGSFVLLADLIRAFGAEHEVDFLSLTRFNPDLGHPTSVRVLHDLSANIEGRLVVVVEGIRTAGTKTEYVDQFLRLHGPEEILYCALVRQKASASSPVPLDCWGFEVDDEYVVGYGLDLRERHRNLPYVGVLDSRRATGTVGATLKAG